MNRIQIFLGIVTLCLATMTCSAQDYVGSAVCGSCHVAEYANWQQSHHFHAMEPASAASVLGDFEEAEFVYGDTASRFYTRDGDYFVETENAEGELSEFRITYTFGWDPLQQYLIEMPDGRLQTLSISWDSRPREEGGQRWYHLYPDEVITAEDPLHWTGAFQNWNSRCASCHSTNLVKNYSAETNTYETVWSEISVGCEACHGPGSNHLGWAAGDTDILSVGFVTELDKVWAPDGNTLPIPEHDGHSLSQQVQVCASCHSRRAETQQPDVALSYFESFTLSPLLEGLYYPDGQMLEEVYVAGSFLQSRMHTNQVSCSNCHDPHSGEPVAEGNGLCLQCHEAPNYETREHYFHPAGSTGALCVNCHMTATTYMGVDSRRDHSFRIPDPIAALAFDTPDACTGCHTDRDTAWAAEEFTRLTGRTGPVYSHTALIADARNNDASVSDHLRTFAEDSSNPAILRGIAMIESARFPGLEHMGTVLQGLADPDPLVRMQAATATVTLDDSTRLEYLSVLFDDNIKAVRLSAARQLAGIPANQVPVALRQRFNALLSEYEQSLLFNADMPESLSDLGSLRASQGDIPGAEEALLNARTISPGYLPAMLNLADVYRARGRDDLGETVLNEAIGLYPDSGDVNYSLGLLYVRTNRTPNSVFLFQRAARLAPDNPQYSLVYAVSLAETGRLGDAILTLEQASQAFPGHPGIREALISYRRSLQSR